MARAFPRLRHGSTVTPLALVVLTAGLAAAWIAGAVSAPLLEGGSDRPGATVRAVYAPVCHQSEGRCLHVGGRPMAVCARCIGLYVGGLVGLVLGATLGAWRRRLPVWVFFAGIAPTLADALFAALGMPSLPNLPRALLADTAGAVCGWFLAAAVGDLAEQLRDRRGGSPLPVLENDVPAGDCSPVGGSRTNGGGA